MKADLYCGDCLEIMKGIPDNSVDLIVTDPPYRLVGGGMTSKISTTSGIFSSKNQNVRSGKMFDKNDLEFSDYIPNLYRILKQSSHCYIFINGRNLKSLQIACENAGFIFQNLLVWRKGNATPNRWYMNACEFILLLRKGKAKPIRDMGTKNVIDVPNIIGKKAHPSEKPTDLLRVFIENSSEVGDIVLDPFMGCGTTGIACVNTGRNFIGIEIDEGFFVTARTRIDEARKAV